MRDHPVCGDCGCRSPRTDTNYTLISKRHGWRLTRTNGVDGCFVVEWRCPVCAARQRASTAASKSTPTLSPRVFFRNARQLLAGDVAPPSSR